MRNIAVANRQRLVRLNNLNVNKENTEALISHLEGDKYIFDDISYKIDLNIDSEPLEKTYKTHEVKADSIDLRDMFGMIRNQGTQGSCCSFAVASVIEALRHDKQTYSPAFLYWNVRAVNNTTDKDTGASIYDVIRAATQFGDCLEEHMPYSQDYTIKPDKNAFGNALNCRIIEAQTVEPKIDAIKSALSDGFPVIIAARIFDSFSDTRSGFVRNPLSDELSKERSDGHGNHALVVCGFSDSERVFVVRNSWGTNFGDNGYCYIPYSYAKEYFLQACIITKVSVATGVADLFRTKTLAFAISDASIESAILQNLIEEDNIELSNLALQSTSLKTLWTQNVGTLENVNNQKAIIETQITELYETIKNEQEYIEHLQSTKENKLLQYSKTFYKKILSSFGSVLLTVLIAIFTPFIITKLIALLMVVILICIVGQFLWKRKVYRQDLIDEIQTHSYVVDQLKENINTIELSAHIYGKILRGTCNYKVKLHSQLQKMRLFNAEIKNYTPQHLRICRLCHRKSHIRFYLY